MRILVDSNVYIDVLLKREPFSGVCREFLEKCRKYRHLTYCTPQTMRDVGYAIHKHTHSKEIAIRAMFYLHQTTRTVIGITGDDAINALFEDANDYEDALQYLAAERNHLDAVVTNNIRDFQKSHVPVYTPEQIVAYWEGRGEEWAKAHPDLAGKMPQ